MAITFKEVTYTYSPDTPFEFEALKNISTKIEDNSVTAIMDTQEAANRRSCSIHALLKPTGGTV